MLILKKHNSHHEYNSVQQISLEGVKCTSYNKHYYLKKEITEGPFLLSVI